MRLLLLSTLLVISAATSAFAQPTVNSNALPTAGFTPNVQYGTTSTMLSPGSAGANATWNFASFSGGSTSALTYLACPGTTGCATFPGSNLVGTETAGSSGASSTYFSVLSGIQAITGTAVNGQNIIYSNSEDYIRTPMTFNSTFTDPFAATISGSTPIYRIGSATNLVDGYGTLVTPAGTFNNVLRVKRTSIYRDSIPGFGTMLNYSATTYLWYSPSVRDYLFVIASLTSTPMGGSGSTVNTAGYRTNITSSVNDAPTASAFFQVSPNPAQDRLNLRWNAGMEATASLTDLTGRTLMQQAGRGGVSFDVAARPRGLYVLRVQDTNGAVHSEKVTLR